MKHCAAFVHTSLPWKSSKYYIFWVWVCSISYQRGYALVPFCHLWAARS